VTSDNDRQILTPLARSYKGGVGQSLPTEPLGQQAALATNSHRDTRDLALSGISSIGSLWAKADCSSQGEQLLVITLLTPME